MEKNQKEESTGSLLHDIGAELKRLFQALLGKQTLASYLETISEFTDNTIRNAEQQESLDYQTGECALQYDAQQKKVITQIKLRFQNATGTWLQKEARRSIDENRFLTGELNGLKTVQNLTFEVKAPK
ncbi:MAG: hypothetical protein RR415_02835 [Ruthenibacterium sp.]